MTKGTSAPPMIPEHRIPAKGPWCWGTEFKPSDTRVGHMIEAKKPMQGKATRDTSAGPNRAADSMHSAPMRKSDQYAATVEELQQAHPQETAGGHESPVVGHRIRTSLVGIDMVIALEKRRHPIGRALLAADVGNDREKIQPDVWIAQQLPVHGKRARRLLRRTLHLG